MTNNDELAIKPVGNLFISDKCEVVFSPSKRPIAGFQFAGSVYSAEQVNALLAERDADKKLIAELNDTLERECEKSRRMASRIAELEARTVSVKLPKKESEEPVVYGGSGAFRMGRSSGFNEAIDIMSERLAAAGIKLEVGE